MKTQRLKYMMLSRLPGGEWLTGATLTSWKKAHEYGINTSNGGLDCAMVVTRGSEFEYETNYYGLSESQKTIQSLPKE